MNQQTVNQEVGGKVTLNGLSKRLILQYKEQNPVKFESKFGRLDLDVLEMNQVFKSVKEMEAFIASKKVVKEEKVVEETTQPEETTEKPVVKKSAKGKK